MKRRILRKRADYEIKAGDVLYTDAIPHFTVRGVKVLFRRRWPFICIWRLYAPVSRYMIVSVLDDVSMLVEYEP